jgi:hypothetical protein
LGLAVDLEEEGGVLVLDREIGMVREEEEVRVGSVGETGVRRGSEGPAGREDEVVWRTGFSC